jgi:hypothetical protein
LTLAVVAVLVLAGQDTVLEQIQQQYDRFAVAYVKNDVMSMLRVLDPSYEIVDIDGTIIPMAKYRTILEGRKQRGQKVAGYSVRIIKLSLSGQTATAMSEETSAAIGAQNVKVIKVHQYEDTWAHHRGSWRLKRSKTLKEG